MSDDIDYICENFDKWKADNPELVNVARALLEDAEKRDSVWVWWAKCVILMTMPVMLCCVMTGGFLSLCQIFVVHVGVPTLCVMYRDLLCQLAKQLVEESRRKWCINQSALVKFFSSFFPGALKNGMNSSSMVMS